MSKIYLSRFRIERKEALKHHLASAYALHKLFWQCFPGRPEAERDFLFRCDHQGAALTILMLSSEMPTRCSWAEWDGTKELDITFNAGTFYWFRLRANPTSRAQASGKLRALTDREDLDDWLNRKGKQHGFALRTQSEYSNCHLEQFSKSSNGPVVSLNVVDMGGVLCVTDAAAFGEAFRRGIGRGRAFGCGMLLLKRIEL